MRWEKNSYMSRCDSWQRPHKKHENPFADRVVVYFLSACKLSMINSDVKINDKMKKNEVTRYLTISNVYSAAAAA